VLYFKGSPADIDHLKLIRKVIELSGGKDALNAEMDRKLSLINEKWNQDVDAVGRILRAQLFVEYFLTEYLIALNPNLGDLKGTRLTFSQKLSLVENHSNETKELASGIRRLNTIRNQLAHQLEAKVTDQDKESLLSLNNSFRYLREALAEPNAPSSDNLVVLEDFAKHVGSRLASLADPEGLSPKISQAMCELAIET
jgi:preprotein translocase subunit Sec63